MFRVCVDCGHLLYADRREHHKCDGVVLDLKADDFDLVQSLLGVEANRGLSVQDFVSLAVTCGDCKRLCQATSADFHECIRHPKIPVPRFRD